MTSATTARAPSLGARLGAPTLALAILLTAGCGSSGGRSVEPTPVVSTGSPTAAATSPSSPFSPFSPFSPSSPQEASVTSGTVYARIGIPARIGGFTVVAVNPGQEKVALLLPDSGGEGVTLHTGEPQQVRGATLTLVSVDGAVAELRVG